MPLEEKFDGFMRQYEFDRQQDERRAKQDKHLVYAYIAWGFTLVMAVLAIPGGISGAARWVDIGIAAAFFIAGWAQYLWSLRWRSW